MKAEIKFGVIGCSKIAEKSSIPAIKNSKNSTLQMVGSRINSKAEKFAKKFSIPEFGSYDEVLENDKIDAVYISLPISLHEKWALKAAKSGKHILCEKSAVISHNSAKKVLNECKKNDVRIMENFIFKFHPQHKKVSEIIKKNTIGKINSFHGKYGFNLLKSNGDFRFNKELGGGSLNDAGCYLVAASKLIFQDMPICVFSNLEINKNSKIDECGNSMIIFPKNIIVNISFGYKNYFQSTYEIWGNNGMIKTERAFNVPDKMAVSLKLYHNDRIKNITIKPVNQFQLAIEGFCNEIRSKTKKNDFEKDLLEQSLIMDSIRESFFKRKAIFLK
ncbi:Dehydrogenase/oxidoreductase [metagenome]